MERSIANFHRALKRYMGAAFVPISEPGIGFGYGGNVTDLNVRRSMGLRLTVIARLLRKQFDHSASNKGITRAQWSTIAAVASSEGTTQRAIATLLEVGEVTVGTVDRSLVRRRLAGTSA